MSQSVYENIMALGEHFGYSMPEIADMMEVCLSTLYHRQKDPDGFTLRELQNLADKMGICVAALLTEESKKECPVILAKARCHDCEHELPLGGCGCLEKGKK